MLEEAAKLGNRFTCDMLHQKTHINIVIYRMKDILEPFAIANNVAQAGYTHLDHVGLTLGNLYHIHNNPSLEAPIHD